MTSPGGGGRRDWLIQISKPIRINLDSMLIVLELIKSNLYDFRLNYDFRLKIVLDL